MGDHPVTGQLSSLLPTILGWRRPGKIGSANTEKAPNRVSFLFPIKSRTAGPKVCRPSHINMTYLRLHQFCEAVYIPVTELTHFDF